MPWWACAPRNPGGQRDVGGWVGEWDKWKSEQGCCSPCPCFSRRISAFACFINWGFHQCHVLLKKERKGVYCFKKILHMVASFGTRGTGVWVLNLTVWLCGLGTRLDTSRNPFELVVCKMGLQSLPGGDARKTNEIMNEKLPERGLTMLVMELSHLCSKSYFQRQ